MDGASTPVYDDDVAHRAYSSYDTYLEMSEYCEIDLEYCGKYLCYKCGRITPVCKFLKMNKNNIVGFCKWCDTMLKINI